MKDNVLEQGRFIDLGKPETKDGLVFLDDAAVMQKIMDLRLSRNHGSSYDGTILRALARRLAMFSYYVIEEDLSRYPNRDDWPGWNHPGNHPEIGRKYWNYFFYGHPDSELIFDDRPDFSGIIRDGKGPDISFQGDVGQVSLGCLNIVMLQGCRMWVTVENNRQIILIKEIFE